VKVGGGCSRAEGSPQAENPLLGFFEERRSDLGDGKAVGAGMRPRRWRGGKCVQTTHQCLKAPGGQAASRGTRAAVAGAPVPPSERRDSVRLS
jgi:hypothetical protein